MNETIKLASLTNEEVALLESLNDQPLLLEAIRKVLLIGVQSNGVAKAERKASALVAKFVGSDLVGGVGSAVKAILNPLY